MCKRVMIPLLILTLWLSSPSSGELIGWWTFEDAANLGADSSGKGNNGTVAGDATFSDSAFQGTGALLLDGTDDYINVGLGKDNMLADWSSNLSIAAWAKPDSLSRTWNCFFGHSGQNNGLKFELMGSTFRFTTLGIMDYDLPTSLTAGDWIHVAVTFNQAGSLVTFYANGVSVGQVSGGNSPAATATGIYSVGYGGYWEPEQFQGLLDDVRIYNNVLTAAEIKTLAFRPKAYGPDPADGTIDVTQPLFQWKAGSSAKSHDVYFGTSAELVAADRVETRTPWAMHYHLAPLTPGVTYYWRVDEVEANGTTYTGDVWSFTVMPNTAFVPSPPDGAGGIHPAPALGWRAGQLATDHRVFFGSSFADVNEGATAADRGLLKETQFSPGLLRSSTTYYWRVDETQSTGAVQIGKVWSFTTADGVNDKVAREWWDSIGGTAVSALTGNANFPNNPTGTERLDAFDGPHSDAAPDNYGSRLYGWLKPPETGEYTFWVAGDDETQLWLSTDMDPANAQMIANVPGWTPYLDFDNTGGGGGGASQKSAAITLQAGQKYYMMALHKEGGGGDSVTAAWQGPGIAAREIIPGQYFDTFALPPLEAFSPSPANGAVDTFQEVVLSWSAGEKATRHEVYLGEDANAVAAADASSSLFQGSQTGTSFDAGSLEWGKTYYWRVDETDGTETWKGNVWSFTTANFIAIDDMESYTDEEGVDARIYENWLDGLINGTGSMVGYWDPPFAEQTIVHGGKQSMPLDYNNINNPFYSEAEREFAPLQNWTVNDVNALSLWFRGNAVRFLETGTDSITMSSTSGDVWLAVDHFRFVFKRLSGDGSISARVDSMTNTAGWAKAGVMIRDSLDVGAMHAFEMLAPDGRTAFQNRQLPDDQSYSAHSNSAAVTFPYWIKVERKANQFTAYNSSDGVNWVLQSDEGAGGSPNPQTVNMGTSVYLGLMVTSNNLARACVVEFSNIKTTGNVTGQWQAADVGPAIVGNDPAPLYVAVEDSSGKSAVAVHPDAAAAVITTAWTEWKIPLDSLSGINLGKVKKLYIGVGDRNNATPDGHGLIYIDDIRVVRP